jgi:RNA polymerase sigma factor for flagellar operon FliA
MPERHELEATFVANLPVLERILAVVQRRHGLRGEQGEEFASWVKLRLVEDDYAVFGKFRGDSSLATYLTVVVTMLLRDYRVAHWGRWRASAEARRRGPLAVRLETLVHRDHFTLEEAAQLLRTAGETTGSDRELASLLAALPARLPLRPVSAGAQLLVDAPAANSADDLVAASELDDEQREATNVLDSALDRLPVEERVILRMRYWEGASVADVARALNLAQKPLYRRIERALSTLRAELERQGVSAQRVRALLADADTPGDITVTGPSNRWARPWRLIR